MRGPIAGGNPNKAGTGWSIRNLTASVVAPGNERAIYFQGQGVASAAGNLDVICATGSVRDLTKTVITPHMNLTCLLGKSRGKRKG
jgi:hypothetical protein